ncbi:MAG: tRNA lysidine(34) synthetase TilS [Rubrivivax sp.]|nr:MAG: tRNA lysidine(34) synthetase TilS [Rubrivivax sp.]
MAASTTPPSTEAASGEPAARCVAVACSGGRDSMALLHATVCMAAELNAELPEEPPMRVLACHVHHGLNAAADAWLTHVQSTCQAWAARGLPVSLAWRHVTIPITGGDSVEAEARRARYAALADMAHAAGCHAVWLAHHRRDQAETFLLQSLRGAGAAGLSAMPAQAVRDGIRWIRPWLARPREDIEAYVAHHGLAFVDDDSNLDGRFSRNRLRLAVWPALSAAFEGAEASLAQAASHQADLKACLDEWAAWQLPEVTSAASGRSALNVAAWLARQPGPQRELLRAWFAQAAGMPMPMSGVHRLQHDLLRMAERQGGKAVKGAARWPCPGSGGTAWSPVPGQGAGTAPSSPTRELVLYRGWLSVREVPPAAADIASGEGTFDVVLSIAACGEVRLPAGLGHLSVEPVEQGGLALSRLTHCRLLKRHGGEQFQLAPNRPARSLKKQFQSMAVPAWARQGPLLYLADQLVFVPGLGIDARAWAPQGEPQVQLRWQPTQIGGKFDHACIPDAKTPAGG